MTQLIESGAAQIAARIPLGGANFDFEVLSLPGGSETRVPEGNAVLIRRHWQESSLPTATYRYAAKLVTTAYSATRHEFL